MKATLYSALAAAMLGCSVVQAATKINALNYNPKREDGTCPNVDQVKGDLEKLQDHTKRLRIYSAKDCNQGEPVLRAMENTDWKLTLGLWVGKGRDAFDADKKELARLAKVFDFKKQVEAVVVGSEALYRKDCTQEELLKYIGEVRETLKSVGLEDLPVTAAETWPYYSPELIDAVDFIFVHVFPFWEGKKIEDAQKTIYDHIYDLQKIAKKKKIVVGETGWPTNGGNYGDAVPNVKNLQTYLQDFVCRANDEKLDYFWFSAIDEGWKPTTNASSVEAHWGLLDSKYKPKISQEPWYDCKNYVPRSVKKDSKDEDKSSDSEESSSISNGDKASKKSGDKKGSAASDDEGSSKAESEGAGSNTFNLPSAHALGGVGSMLLLGSLIAPLF
ncbi:glycoside hydrolase 3 protein [Mycoemilia scoparia]|uniref:glucan endo-1,3-beta-D-glucosidase n=1 Tax=Mycoemilia scoparia TaxID=417184 RepID=A0A9W8DR85_9FUNG|nr:glycoside hydrolase 3 protein [Mycoemilia scoparia]